MPTNATDPTGQYLIAANRDAADKMVGVLQKYWQVKAAVVPLKGEGGRFYVYVPQSDWPRLQALQKSAQGWDGSVLWAASSSQMNLELYNNDTPFPGILWTTDTDQYLGDKRGQGYAPASAVNSSEAQQIYSHMLTEDLNKVGEIAKTKIDRLVSLRRQHENPSIEAIDAWMKTIDVGVARAQSHSQALQYPRPLTDAISKAAEQIKAKAAKGGFDFTWYSDQLVAEAKLAFLAALLPSESSVQGLPVDPEFRGSSSIEPIRDADWRAKEHWRVYNARMKAMAESGTPEWLLNAAKFGDWVLYTSQQAREEGILEEMWFTFGGASAVSAEASAANRAAALQRLQQRRWAAVEAVRNPGYTRSVLGNGALPPGTGGVGPVPMMPPAGPGNYVPDPTIENLAQGYGQAAEASFAEAVKDIPASIGPVVLIVVPGTGFNPPLVQPPVGRSRRVTAPDTPILQDLKDATVNPNPPPPSGRDLAAIEGVGGKGAQKALLADLTQAEARGAEDIRINQEQVNAAGQRVGINKPDLQYTLDGVRYYIEYDTVVSGRGPEHAMRILANDETGVVILKTVPKK